MCRYTTSIYACTSLGCPFAWPGYFHSTGAEFRCTLWQNEWQCRFCPFFEEDAEVIHWALCASCHAVWYDLCVAENPTSPSSQPNTVDITQEQPIKTRTLLSLPNETLYQIVDYLEEPDLASVVLLNRRLNAVADPVLYNRAGKDELKGKQVLLWAAEMGCHKTATNMLIRGVNPDSIYLSPILWSRLADVFKAQGRRGASGPKSDHHLDSEHKRDIVCRDYYQRDDRSLRWFNRRSEYSNRHLDYGPTLDGHSYYKSRIHWHWAAIHLAAHRGDNEMIAILLDHGADINALSVGLCDCALPNKSTSPYDNDENSVTPERGHPLWTPLHIAICSGHPSTVELLMFRKAPTLVGGIRPRNYNAEPGQTAKLTITAIHSAAMCDSSEICTLVTKSGTPKSKDAIKSLLSRTDHNGETALHYAAAAGHLNTVGKCLLRLGGKTLLCDHYESILKMLCRRYKCRNALILLDHRSLFFVKGAVEDFTPILEIICELHEVRRTPPASLRQQQDELYNPSPFSILNNFNSKRTFHEGLDDTRQARLEIAGRLIQLGAYPLVKSPDNNSNNGDYIPGAFQSAVKACFPEMVRFLASGEELGWPDNDARYHLMEALSNCRREGGLNNLKLLLEAIETPIVILQRPDHESDRLETIKALLEAFNPGVQVDFTPYQWHELFKSVARAKHDRTKGWNPMRVIKLLEPHTSVVLGVWKPNSGPQQLGGECLIDMLSCQYHNDEELVLWILEQCIAPSCKLRVRKKALLQQVENYQRHFSNHVSNAMALFLLKHSLHSSLH
ncbi:hypothetical protein B0H66DRAFT_631605 [Apodospora peruviana]|uniref:F-box domain-containing protein n=1 Tax=Apodospora peruviana TaxID=516989 RepID=A0AAE0HTU4_9PEZI|nr:hypothetical protein B0H66DRAFT_631605 [Apodospora peruviana]